MSEKQEPKPQQQVQGQKGAASQKASTREQDATDQMAKVKKSDVCKQFGTQPID